MNNLNKYTLTILKNRLSIKFIGAKRIAVNLSFCLIFLTIYAGLTAAKSYNFYQSGQIRAIVSETASGPIQRNVQNIDFNFPHGAKSRLDFYFNYSTSENGKPVTKWILLPYDRA
jgi:hypothetical protein